MNTRTVLLAAAFLLAAFPLVDAHGSWDHCGTWWEIPIAANNFDGDAYLFFGDEFTQPNSDVWIYAETNGIDGLQRWDGDCFEAYYAGVEGDLLIF